MPCINTHMAVVVFGLLARGDMEASVLRVQVVVVGAAECGLAFI